MTDFAQNQQTEIAVPHVVQYQDKAIPPPTTQSIAPPFFATYAPSRLHRFYPEHPPGAFSPAGFETLPAPDFGQRALYPDRLARSAFLWPMPQPVSNLEPITAPTPDFGNRAYFPDRLDRIRALTQYPYRSEQNLDPIANPVPDFMQANFPSYLRTHGPNPPPHRFYTPTPSTFPVPEEYSRGLYLGDTRGLYHTLKRSSAEPNFSVVSLSNQVIPNSILTTVDLSTASGHQGYGASNGDPWGLLIPALDYLVLKHTGRYIVGFRASWEDAAAGVRGVLVQLVDDSGTAVRTIVRVILPTAGVGLATLFTGTSDIQPLLAGQRITVQVQQTSGGDLDLQQLFLWGVRLAPQLPELST